MQEGIQGHLEKLTKDSLPGMAVLVALFATWHPARQAARVDPAITLRSE